MSERSVNGTAPSYLTAVSVFVAMIALERSVYPVLLAVTVLIHEVGHVVMAYLSGAGIHSLGAGLYRLCLYYDPGKISYGREALICAGGVIFNFILAALAIPFLPGESACFLFVSNITAALFNLLPLRVMDGGGILRCFLLAHTDMDRAESIARAVSAIATVALWLVSVYLQLALGGSFSLFALSVYMIADTVLDG